MATARRRCGVGGRVFAVGCRQSRQRLRQHLPWRPPPVQFSPAGEDAKVTIQGETYALLQMHFHAPSEHTFNGQHALMEAHLVHKHVKTGVLLAGGLAGRWCPAAGGAQVCPGVQACRAGHRAHPIAAPRLAPARLPGELAVLGVLLEAGAEKPNDPLEAVLASAPAEAGVSAPLGKPVSLQVRGQAGCVCGRQARAGCSLVQRCPLGGVQGAQQSPAQPCPQALLPKARPDGRRAYATYPGSLTTPPCTEGLVWVVFLDKVPVQATQVREGVFSGEVEEQRKGTAHPPPACTCCFPGLGAPCS